MTSAQVVETSVINNSSFQNYTHLDDHTIRTTDAPGFKPFTILSESSFDWNERHIPENTNTGDDQSYRYTWNVLKTLRISSRQEAPKA